MRSVKACCRSRPAAWPRRSSSRNGAGLTRPAVRRWRRPEDPKPGRPPTVGQRTLQALRARPRRCESRAQPYVVIKRLGSSQRRCRRSISADSFAGAPRGMMGAQIDQRPNDVLRRTIGRRIGPGGAILEAWRAIVQIAIDPFVAGLAPDAVIRAQFADRKTSSEVIDDELRLLVHG
jgi:hypothetical protein